MSELGLSKGGTTHVRYTIEKRRHFRCISGYMARKVFEIVSRDVAWFELGRLCPTERKPNNEVLSIVFGDNDFLCKGGAPYN